MLHIRNTLFGLAALAVTACGPMDAVTRSVPYETTMPTVIEGAAAPEFSAMSDVVTRAVPDLQAFPAAPSYNVVDVQVNVPRSLRVSESNLLFPLGDIVWREDPRGDRYAQVEAILDNAVRVGTQGFNGAQDVILTLEVARFHSLSQRARYSIGGVHNIKFDMTILDAATGLPVAPTWAVDASFDALGGNDAIEAEANGQTQKIRITDYVANVVASELQGLQMPPVTTVASAQ